MYYLQSRYYDPSTRRFINADNVAVVATDYLTTLNGQNLYSYCLNDPVNSYDPTGHDAVNIIMLIVAIIGLIGALVGLAFAVSAFAKEPSWLNLLFVVIAVIEVVMSVMGVVAAIKAVCAKPIISTAKQFVDPDYIGTIDGVDIYKAKKSDFTDEAWEEIIKLTKDADGNTISNAKSGRKIHDGFRLDVNGNSTKASIKGAGKTTGKYGFVDSLDKTTKTIYELKPNNPRSIEQGIKQLHRYSKAHEKIYLKIPRMVLVLY